jgi:phosphoribosylformylglycinamidine cyclo-ligase
MLDYIAVQTPHPRLLEELARGLHRACELADITIPGGEVAQVREMLKGVRDDWSFDLVGAAAGIVEPDKIITGTHCRPGDVVIGIASSGLHSNGYTLARRICFETARHTVHAHIAELGGPLGETLLEPTYIYVKEIMAVIKAGLPVTGMAHITSDGLTNLLRVDADVSFDIDFLPPPPPIFGLLQKWGRIPPAEMFEVFNMGVGFCIVVGRDSADGALRMARSDGKQAWVIGHVSDGPKEVRLHPVGLVGRGNHFSTL